MALQSRRTAKVKWNGSSTGPVGRCGGAVVPNGRGEERPTARTTRTGSVSLRQWTAVGGNLGNVTRLPLRGACMRIGSSNSRDAGATRIGLRSNPTTLTPLPRRVNFPFLTVAVVVFV